MPHRARFAWGKWPVSLARALPRSRQHYPPTQSGRAGVDANMAAFDVGCECTSQFAGEYKPLFGQPLMRDVKSQRLTGASAMND